MEYFVSQVSELWIVARCNCAKLRSWRSQNHLDCLFIEPWITEQIKVIADNTFNKKGEIFCEEKNKESPNYCESLDSLQADTTTTTTFDKLSFLPRYN
uniref:Uncharacterized protein n=1 Tax=Panagrolaimus sp. PS1159 TaxID=55785 RepID=A0AC35FF80_9BILA